VDGEGDNVQLGDMGEDWDGAVVKDTFEDGVGVPVTAELSVKTALPLG